VRTRTFIVVAIALCSSAASVRSIFAQAPCAVSSAVADSAREDVNAVLESGSKLVRAPTNGPSRARSLPSLWSVIRWSALV
jgi:hypothetical protein